MARVQEGAFDPGPPPPEPPKVEEQPAEQPKEDLRAKCLRRLKEQEANEAKPFDWYGHLAGNADPGDAASFTMLRRMRDRVRAAGGYSMQWSPDQLREARETTQGMLKRGEERCEGPKGFHIRLDPRDFSPTIDLIFESPGIGAAMGSFTKRMSAREVANELHRLAHRIEKTFCVTPRDHDEVTQGNGER